MRRLLIALCLLLLSNGLWAVELRIEPIPFGDMNQWVMRYVKESDILGGKTKYLYTLGATDTIRVNGAYTAAEGNPWGSSDFYYKTLGLHYARCGSVYPETRGHGFCCRLRNELTYRRKSNIYTMTPGTIYMGHALEPLSTDARNRPYTTIDWNIPFTERPIALMLDYKASIQDTDSMISTLYNRIDTVAGHDCAVICIYFQYRWEDPETGKIYARRVGTLYEEICHTIPEWINNHMMNIQWGNITQDPNFVNEKEGLNQMEMMTRNSKEKMVRIEEVGWSLDIPTHIVMYISSSNAGLLRGCEDNTLWVDNLRWVYKDE